MCDAFAGCWRVFNATVQQEASHRLDVTIGFLFLWVPILLNVLLWRAVYAADDRAAVQLGYSERQTATYFVVALLCVRLLGSSGIHDRIIAQVLSGEMNRFLLQPVGHFGYHFIEAIALKAVQATYLIAPAAILLVVFKSVLVFPSIAGFSAFLLAVILSIILAFHLYYCLGTLAFWLGRADQIAFFASTAISLVDGSKFPITFLPPAVAGIVSVFPFQYVFYFPLHLFITTEASAAIVGGLINQAAWILLLHLVLRVLWRRGLRRYGAFGG